MTAHLKIDGPAERDRLEEMVQGVIGLPLSRPEGPLKVTGRATYAHEWPVDGLAHGVLVRAPVARGRVTAVDRAAIEALPGVLAVITDKRLLRNPAQGTADQAPVQDPSEIDYLGQPIALVVAESFETARHGAQMLKLEIEPAGDAAFDPEAVEPETPEAEQSSQGDLEQAMAEAAFTVDATYRTPAGRVPPAPQNARLWASRCGGAG
jgi:xanthine dehydrogenase YagR molybdenum-binding subunit